MSEFELIDRIRERCKASRGDVLIGIGDDAALLQVPAGQQLVATTDTLVEGVHFPAGTTPADIGWKALAVNLSDLAAMGATPAWVLLSLTVPQASPAFVDALLDGMAALAGQHAVALVGGDTCCGPFAIGITALGLVPAGTALTRAGARVGDLVCVTGTLGDAAAGLRLLSSPDRPCAIREPLLQRLARPTPRVAAGLALRGRAHACIDVSDGLLADLGHVARASGVGIELDATALPLSPALRAAFDVERARELALTGGDDYELVFSAPVGMDLADVPCRSTCIGRVVPGEGVRVLVDGCVLPLAASGWEHFS